ncbi:MULTISPECIES: hypothetical protein [unclassified Streptomyces]|uniref:hypothetical protein n=1 Tax=unclassified Streptomyces TaxID=2593676 RepID=UPI0036FF2A24
MGRGTPPTGALPGTTAAPALASGTARAAPGPSVTRTGRTTPDGRTVLFLSHDGPAGNDSFRRNGPLTHRGHQHAAWCTAWSTAGRGAVVGGHASPGTGCRR